MYQKMVLRKDYVDLLLKKEEGKSHYNLIKDFNLFMYDIGEEKIFVVIVSKILDQKKILKRHIKDCFKINDKKKD